MATIPQRYQSRQSPSPVAAASNYPGPQRSTGADLSSLQSELNQWAQRSLEQGEREAKKSAREQAIQQQSEAGAGEITSPDEEWAPRFQDAFREQAIEFHSQQLELDAQREVSRLARENQNDPEAFRGAVSSYAEGITADLFAKNEVVDDNGTPVVNLSNMYSTMEGKRLFVLDSSYLWRGEYTVQYDNGFYIDVSDSGLSVGDDAYTGGSYTATLEMFPPSPGPEAVNRKKRIIRTLAGVYQAADLRIDYVSALQGPPKLGRTTNALVSGTFEVRTLGWGPDHTTTLESSRPYDCTILSVTREVQVT